MKEFIERFINNSRDIRAHFRARMLKALKNYRFCLPLVDWQINVGG